jgi:ATP synthase protein I
VKPSDRLVRAEPIDLLLKWQSVTLVVTVLIVFVWQGSLLVCIAYLYGGGIAISNSLLQRWHLFAAAKTARADASMNLGRAYRCVAERWVLTIVLFAIGFLVFVSAEMLLAGFVVAQTVVLFGHYNRA